MQESSFSISFTALHKIPVNTPDDLILELTKEQIKDVLKLIPKLKDSMGNPLVLKGIDILLSGTPIIRLDFNFVVGFFEPKGCYYIIVKD